MNPKTMFSKLRTMLLILPAVALPAAALADNGLTVMDSRYSVTETEQRLVEAIEAKGMGVMAQIDHRANASSVGLDMRPTRLVIFGNPKGGTQLMQCAPTVAIDLPMKMLIWQEDETVRIGYNQAEYLVERHGIGDCAAPVQAKMKQVLAGLARTAAGD